MDWQLLPGSITSFTREENTVGMVSCLLKAVAIPIQAILYLADLLGDENVM